MSGSIQYSNLWRGIDLTYVNDANRVKSVYTLAPGARVSDIRLRYHAPARMLAGGGLEFKVGHRLLRERAPIAWQERAGRREVVPVWFAIMPEADAMTAVTFEAGPYDPALPLVIDPTYEWHTFYGGTQYDAAIAVAADSTGLYVTGRSDASWNGPAGESPLHAYSGGWEVFVQKLDAEGNYLWHTFYGSAMNNWGTGIGIYNNELYIGFTSGPTWLGAGGQPPLHAHSQGLDAGVLKLSKNGAYVWHTFIGGPKWERAYGMAVNSTGVYITGDTESTWNGPAGQAPLNPYANANDAWVMKLALNGDYVWHAFYGATGFDEAGALDVDSDSNVYVVGKSNSTWQGPGDVAPKHAHTLSQDLFVLKLSSVGAYQWHTFYGAADFEDDGRNIAVDSNTQALYVVGASRQSFNGPSGEAPLQPHAASDKQDLLIVKLDGQGNYEWHTFYGSDADDYALSALLSNDGGIFVSGISQAAWNGPDGIAPVNAYVGLPEDTFVLKISPAGAYWWHWFFGAAGLDRVNNMATYTDLKNRLIGIGSSDAQWTGPNGEPPLHAATANTAGDAFVMKLVDEMPITVQFGQPIMSVGEEAGAAEVPVALSGSSAQTVTVKFATVNGTATASSDYTAQTGTLTFAPGQITRTLSIPITPDSADEPDETLSVILQEANNAAISRPNTFLLTVADDDAPALQLSAAQLAFTATLNSANPAAQALQVSGVSAWQAAKDVSWINLSTLSGGGAATISVTANTSGLAEGLYTGTVTFTAPALAPAPANSSRAVTVRLRVISSSVSDPFESDDDCANAGVVSPDGVAQPRTFGKANDADWILFNVISGNTYIVASQIPAGSPADTALELYSNCNTPTQGQNLSFSPGSRLEFKAAATGPVYARWTNEVETVYGSEVDYNVTVNTRATTPDLGAVIIIAGRISLGDGLQKNIHTVTNGIYRMFLERGYSADRIYYAATNLTMPGVDASPTITNVQVAITTWARQWLADGRSLTIYMMDHGGEDVFYLDEITGQQLTPDQLNTWLGALESQYANLKVNVFVDACFAGSFITAPGSISKPGRVVVASTRPDRVAFATHEGAIFSDHFVAALSRGQSVFDSFLRANWSTTLAHPDQSPMIDDNGDGQANTSSDGAESQRRGFSFVGTLAGPAAPQENWPPFVAQAAVQRAITSTSPSTLRARVVDNGQVREVYAKIYAPDYTPPQSQAELVQEAVPTVILTLQDAGDASGFSASLPPLTQSGRYRLVVFAKDDQGLPAQPFELFVDTRLRMFLPTAVR